MVDIADAGVEAGADVGIGVGTMDGVDGRATPPGPQPGQSASFVSSKLANFIEEASNASILPRRELGIPSRSRMASIAIVDPMTPQTGPSVPGATSLRPSGLSG
jgi:hypothetical protein